MSDSRFFRDDNEVRRKTPAGPFDKLRAGSSTSLRMIPFVDWDDRTKATEKATTKATAKATANATANATTKYRDPSQRSG